MKIMDIDINVDYDKQFIATMKLTNLHTGEFGHLKPTYPNGVDMVEHLEKLILHYHVVTVLVDDVGFGAAVVDELRKRLPKVNILPSRRVIIHVD